MHTLSFCRIACDLLSVMYLIQTKGIWGNKKAIVQARQRGAFWNPYALRFRPWKPGLAKALPLGRGRGTGVRTVALLGQDRLTADCSHLRMM